MNREEKALYQAVVNALYHCEQGPCKDCPCYRDNMCRLHQMALVLLEGLAERVEDLEAAGDLD